MKKSYLNQILSRCRSYFLLFATVLSVSFTSLAQKATVINSTNDEFLLSNKAVKFSPDAFMISGYFHHNKIINRTKVLREMAECYLNVADAADPQNFSLCEKLGLSVLVSKGPHLSGNDWQKLSVKEIDDYVRLMVKKGGKSKSIIGYYICDEPSALAFPALSKAVEAVKKYAPGKLAYITLFPNYATRWKLEQGKSSCGKKTKTINL